MPGAVPTEAQATSVAAELGLHLCGADFAAFRGLMAGCAAAGDAVDKLPDILPTVTCPRTLCIRPEAADDAFKA